MSTRHYESRDPFVKAAIDEAAIWSRSMLQSAAEQEEPGAKLALVKYLSDTWIQLGLTVEDMGVDFGEDVMPVIKGAYATPSMSEANAVHRIVCEDILPSIPRTAPA